MNASNQLSWDDARVFLSVIEHKSFSSAAKALRVGQPTVSRRIQLLEEKFQLQLFVRGKHGAEPTVDALSLVPSAEQMAVWAAEFNRALTGTGQSLAGTVTIAAPPGIATEHLVPFAASMQDHAPSIKFEILSSVDYVDLTRGEADLAIRTQPPQEPELVTLHEATVRPIVVACKEYVAKLSQPIELADLNWVTWGGRFKTSSPRAELETLIPNFSPAFCSDDYLTLMAAVEAGLGASVINTRSGLANSNLVEIDVDFELPESVFYVVCAKSMWRVPKVKIVAELLIQGISEV